MYRFRIVIFCVLLFIGCQLFAQDRVVSHCLPVLSSYGLNCTGLSFFRDDEYADRVVTDYTLPGYRFRLSGFVGFGREYPLFLQLGIDNLYYWGAHSYPVALAYRDLAYWTGRNAGRRFHVKPFFSLRFSPFGHFYITLGSYWSRYNHSLIGSLYNPVMQYTSDPENGVRIQYLGGKYQMDTWVNWQSFIFWHERHQEAFIFGHVSDIRLSERKHGAIDVKLQILASHRGGKQNDVIPDTVSSWLNVAPGLVYKTRLPLSSQPNMIIESYLLGYAQRGGHFPINKGWGGTTAVKFENNRFLMSFAWFYARRYLSPWGAPFARTIDVNNRPYNANNSWTFVKAEGGYFFHNPYYKFDSKIGLWYTPMLSVQKWSFYIDLSMSFNLSWYVGDKPIFLNQF